MSSVAFVTGAGRGIGEAVATRLAADGWRVVVAARSADQLERVADATGALAVPLDVTDAGAVSAAVRRVTEELGPVELLVNNAGAGGSSGPTWAKEPAAWWGVFEVNVLGPFLCARAVLPLMSERRSGRIVNVDVQRGILRDATQFERALDSAYLGERRPRSCG